MLNENISRTEEWRKKKNLKILRINQNSWTLDFVFVMLNSLLCLISNTFAKSRLVIEERKKIISMKIWPNIVIRAKVKLKWANILWKKVMLFKGSLPSKEFYSSSFSQYKFFSDLFLVTHPMSSMLMRIMFGGLEKTWRGRTRKRRRKGNDIL